MNKWQKFINFKNWLKGLVSEFGLETLLFFIALGNADVLHYYLIETGSHPSWQLTLAIYATELLVVWASLWRTVGLGISAVLFLVSMVSIRSVFGEYWFGHAGFSLAIFCGSIGNYVRRGGWRELGTAYKFLAKKPILVLVDLSGLSVADIRAKLNISLAHANLLKTMRDNGVTITQKLIEETKC